ncbi:MAG: TonB-dependent receptor, partial [Crocinitomicaceae bacterium]|nr:TonB-dependent receptor [Crocinitomicaceae bacterium]
MRTIFLCLCMVAFCVAPCFLWSQSPQQFTLSGYITDAATGETLIGATVWSEAATVGVVSNLYGFYTLTLPADVYTVQVTFIGYERQRLEVDLSGENVKFNLAMVPGTKLGEAVVTGENESRIEEQVQMSKMEIPMDQVRRLPAIGGEVDLLKSLQLMPGVQSGG